MSNEKSIMLKRNIDHYTELRDKDNIRIIEIHAKDGRKFGIGNPDALRLIIDTCINELERQFHINEFGVYPLNLQESEEYKTAMLLSKALNNMSFNPENFVRTIPYMHRTLQQSLFRLLAKIICFMGDETKYHTDPRNQASHDISKKLVEILKDGHIPFI